LFSSTKTPGGSNLPTSLYCFSYFYSNLSLSSSLFRVWEMPWRPSSSSYWERKS
jgi:hypothetical protein